MNKAHGQEPRWRHRSAHPFSSPPEPAVASAEPEPAELVDLDQWPVMAAGELSGDGPVGSADPDALDALRQRLLRALDDDTASFVPPSAGDMSQDDWDRLPAEDRRRYQEAQLRRLDPRLVSRSLSRQMTGRRRRRT